MWGAKLRCGWQRLRYRSRCCDPQGLRHCKLWRVRLPTMLQSLVVLGRDNVPAARRFRVGPLDSQSKHGCDVAQRQQPGIRPSGGSTTSVNSRELLLLGLGHRLLWHRRMVDDRHRGRRTNRRCWSGRESTFGSSAPGTVYQLDYSSELQSFEFNLRRRSHECLTWVAGFRWIELSDELAAYSTMPSVAEFYSVDADNHLYGIQVGANATLLQPTPRFRVDSIFRMGLMGNAADQTTRAPALANLNGVVDQVSADGSQTSFLAELGLRGVIQLTSGWSVYGGYQVMWLDGLALAPEQIPVTNMIAPGSARLDDDGELLFHGGVVGLQLTF